MNPRQLPQAIAGVTDEPNIALGWTPEIEGPLRSVPRSTRAFHPGERTADLGRLAARMREDDEEHDGARIVIRLPIDEIEAELGDGTEIAELRWWLYPGINEPPVAAEGDDGGDNGDGNGGNGGDDDPDLVQERDLHRDRGLAVRAGVPGLWRLRVQVMDGDGEPVREGHIPLSVPLHVPVDCDRAYIDHLLDELDVPVGQRDTLWEQVVGKAKQVAAHILRPLNVRLWWQPDEQLPAPYADGGGEDGELVVGTWPTSFVWFARVHRVSVAAPDVPVPTVFWYLNGQFGTPIAEHILRDDSAWYFQPLPQLWNSGVVRVGLGARTFANGPAAEGPEADQVLAHLAERAAAEDFDADRDATRRWVELNGRLIGVALARAVALIGGVSSRSADPRDAQERALRPGTDVLDAAPADPLRQLLGLHRPEGAALDEMMTQPDDSDGPRGLDHQARHPDAHDLRASWTDLVAYYERAWQPDEDRRAHPDGSRLTGYDVLAGLVLDATLDSAARRLPLPPPYGGHELTYGDADLDRADGDLPRYGGEEREVLETDDERQVRNLQYDLRQVAITLGIDPENDETAESIGRFGYRRWTLDESKWDGDYGGAPTDHDGIAARQEHGPPLTAGNTALSVRELRIAEKYPNRVFERLDGAPDADRPDDGVARRPPASAHHDADDQGDGPFDEYRHHYGDGLVAVPTNPVPEPDGASPGTDDSLVGDLTYRAAGTLRRWRFSRRRYPVAFEACDGADRTQVQAERLMASRGWISTAERVFYRDLTGYFSQDEDPEWQSMGDFVRHVINGQWRGWSGPRVLWHRHSQRTLQQAEVVPNDAPASDGRVFAIVADGTRPESRNRLDVFNNYDDAVTSIPLGHYTLALGANAAEGQTDGQYARLVRFLRSTPGDLGAWLDNDAEREQASQALNAVHSLAFGFFGAVASELHVPQLTAPTGYVCVPWAEPHDQRRIRTDRQPGQTLGPAQERSLYQAYVQWFRAWPWLHRVMATIRNSPRMRAAMYAFELVNLHHMLETWNRDIDGTNTFDYLHSERDLAYALRLYIRSPTRLISFEDHLEELEQARTAWAGHVVAAVAAAAQDPDVPDIELDDDQQALLQACQDDMTPQVRNQTIFSQLGAQDAQHVNQADLDGDFQLVPDPILDGDQQEQVLLDAVQQAATALGNQFGSQLLVAQVNVQTNLGVGHANWVAGQGTADVVASAYENLLRALPDVALRDPADEED